jgi:hypothetical protein
MKMRLSELRRRIVLSLLAEADQDPLAGLGAPSQPTGGAAPPAGEPPKPPTDGTEKSEDDGDKEDDKKKEKKSSSPGDSLDSQVDSYFTKAETNALTEDGDDSEQTFDVESFASDVIRLIENHEGLLEYRNTLHRRALKRLENYSAEIRDSFQATMKNHGYKIGVSRAERDASFTAPNADRAGESGEA